jgi:hypothetical protein
MSRMCFITFVEAYAVKIDLIFGERVTMSRIRTERIGGSEMYQVISVFPSGRSLVVELYPN